MVQCTITLVFIKPFDVYDYSSSTLNRFFPKPSAPFDSTFISPLPVDRDTRAIRAHSMYLFHSFATEKHVISSSGTAITMVFAACTL